MSFTNEELGSLTAMTDQRLKELKLRIPPLTITVVVRYLYVVRLRPP